MEINKSYKEKNNIDDNIIPCDLKGLSYESFFEENVVFIDGEFLSKVSKHFGERNELIKAIYKYILLGKEDFKNAPLNKGVEK